MSKDVLTLAREAGFKTLWDQYWDCTTEGIERFAELVRADEREKYKWDFHSCGPTCKRYACVSMREAVEAEREACAKVCESKNTLLEWPTYAAAIRARGSNT